MADGNEIADDPHGVFHKLFGEFAQFGGTSKGGVSRLVASPADGQARDHLCAWLESNNFEVTVESVGNIFGTLDLGAWRSRTTLLVGALENFGLKSMADRITRARPR